ncbi:MAG: glutamine-hydrolyzing carbamoyl-phosphate synthase small subunit [Methanobrevibacter sp.]|jgi:carbamoyl-phosphate synthase small subunit|nr:glutamine-hydrolyzing carbamoyl-phosphate synthase small subunit [Candidatus Methanovirga australis]
MENRAKIALEDGIIIEGKSFGYETTATGEIVFSTGMTGYVESLTDPSFNGQILMSTYPLVGNYGVSDEWYQSDKIQAEGYIIREICSSPSKFGADRTLDEFLKEFKVPGISGIDTRELTLKIREKGTMKCGISTEEIENEELIALVKNQLNIVDMELVPQVSTSKIKIFNEENSGKVGIIDCGVKKNIINSFLKKNIGVVLFPYNTSSEVILDHDLDGLMISCGPGNPSKLGDTIDNIRKLTNHIPVFGICMGQQLIAKAFGAKIYKMKFGHRGVNQPVKDLSSNRVFITSQNHGFSVDAQSLNDTPLKLTQINLNDNSPEGLAHEELSLKTVQYHPEAGPGPNDTNNIFTEFKEMMDSY